MGEPSAAVPYVLGRHADCLCQSEYPTQILLLYLSSLLGFR